MKNTDTINCVDVLSNEKLLRLATESSKIGVWSINTRTKDVQRNVYHDMVFGYGEMQDSWDLDSYQKHIYPEDTQELLSKINEILNGGDDFSTEFRILCPDHTIRWVCVTAKRYLFHILGTIVDVTEKKLGEEALYEALIYRDEFLSIASHELKTPLTSLKLQSQLFKRMSSRNDPDTYQPLRIDRLMDQTDSQVNRLVRLVDDMLDVSRIRTGKLTLVKELVNISKLVEEVVVKFRAQYRNSCIDVIHLDQTFFYCDKERIEQVLSILLKNSYRYGSGKAVEVSLKSYADKMNISIKDYGIGISKVNMENIFTRFKRAIPASEVSGFGLGLFMAKQIIEAHKGSIEVVSQLGVGSTFTVLLPFESEEQ